MYLQCGIEQEGRGLLDQSQLGTRVQGDSSLYVSANNRGSPRGTDFEVTNKFSQVR